MFMEEQKKQLIEMISNIKSNDTLDFLYNFNKDYINLHDYDFEQTDA